MSNCNLLFLIYLKVFCPTPCSKYTTYNNSNEGREEDNKGQRGVYVVDNSKGVGQNKNNQLHGLNISKKV